MRCAGALHFSLPSKWQRMNQFVCVCVCVRFLLLKGKERVILPQQQRPWKRGQVQIPEHNFTSSAKILNFAWVQAGPREIIQTAANSPLKPFLQSCFHFQATLEIWKYQEDICSLTWKRHFFFKQRKNIWLRFFLFFYFFLFRALPKECAVILSPCQTFLIYMYSPEGVD